MKVTLTPIDDGRPIGSPDHPLSYGMRADQPVTLEPIPFDTWGQVLKSSYKSVVPSFKRGLGGLLQLGGEANLQNQGRQDSPYALGAGKIFKTKAQLKAEAAKARDINTRIAIRGREMALKAQKELESIQPVVPQGSAKYYVGQAAQSVAQMAPPLVAGALTANPAVTVGLMGLQVAGDQYSTQREAGQSPDSAAGASILYGLAEAIPEALPVHFLLKPGTKLLTRMAQSIGTEVPQEMFTQVLQSAIDKGTIDPNMTWGQAWSAIKDAGIIAGISAPFFAGITHPFAGGEQAAPEGTTPTPPTPPPGSPQDTQNILAEGEKAKEEYQARKRAEAKAAEGQPVGLTPDEVLPPPQAPSTQDRTTSPQPTLEDITASRIEGAPQGVIPATQVWDKTPADVQGEWQTAAEYLDKVDSEIEAQKRVLADQKNALKGKRGKNVTTLKKQIDGEMAALEESRGALQSHYQDKAEREGAVIQEEITRRVKERGIVDEATISDITDNILTLFSDSTNARPFVEANYNETFTNILNNVIDQYSVDESTKEKQPVAERTKGLNPKSFNKGDVIKNVYDGTKYEVVENDKRGMASIRNLSTGKVEDINAHNNPSFEKSSSQSTQAAEPSTEETIAPGTSVTLTPETEVTPSAPPATQEQKPRIIVTKASIRPTRAGVEATQIGEPEVYVYGQKVDESKAAPAPQEKKAHDIGTIGNIDTVALAKVFKAVIDEGTPLNKLKVFKIVADHLGVKVSDLRNNPEYRHRAVEEAFEYALVQKGREIAHSKKTETEKLKVLETVYNNQPNLAVRTSTSIAGQQYSTPLPLALLMGNYLDLGKEGTSVYEPTAGNGMLLIAANTYNAKVNENDTGYRKIHLKDTFGSIFNEDALTVMNERPKMVHHYENVIMNPPFGAVVAKTYDGYKVNKLEHRIAIESLQAMKDDGKSAIIIGGHNFDSKGEMTKADRVFFNYLYSHYNVTHNIDINGAVYSKMGTKFPIRLLTIEGRKVTPDNAVAPYEPGQVESADTFEDVRAILAEPSMAVAIETRRQGNEKGTRGHPELSDGKSGGASEDGKGPQQSGTRTEPSISAGTDRRGAVAVPGGDQGQRDGHSVNDTSRPSGSGELSSDTRIPKSDHGKGAEGTHPGLVSHGRDNGDLGLSGTLPEVKAERVNTFQTEYKPASEGVSGETLTPKNMAGPARTALTKLASKKGNIDDYVQSELGYESKKDLYKALSSEQIDAVAMAIAAIEKRKGIIVGDQTGVGKGRVAAAIIRYANQKGKKPIFFTAKVKLFSDMYGDLLDIGHPIKPFIMHGSPLAGAIVDPDNKVVFKANGSAATYKKMLQDPQAIMENFDAVFVAYSQVQRENRQRQILAELAANNIIILDESHTASGDSSTGKFIVEKILKEAAGVTYLSATYAKKPHTMPVYMKTSLGDTGLPLESLIDAIAQGGVPLQQIMAKSLAEEGQYLRRELNFSEIAMNTVIDTANEARDTKRADEITGLLRDIVEFDKIKMAMVDTMDKTAKKEGKRLTGKKYTTSGVTSANFSSTVHNLVGQLLLGMKADSTIETAVKVLKEDKKALVNLMNTMGSFLDDYLATQGGKVGDVIDFSFKDVLDKALRGTLKYTSKDAYGGRAVTHRLIPERDFDANTLEIYRGIEGKIANLKTEIPASPIDYIKAGIRKAGFSIGEITGRAYIMDYTQNPPVLAKRSAKEIQDRNSTINDFNSGKLDALIYNSAGSTGLSAHASEKFKDQRTRHLIIAQADLNIDTFIQALGRIFRKGQVRNPEYTILQTALPAEIRPAVVLAKKMASLNANTSANADSANTMKGVPDMLNVYGDQVVTEYLKSNTELNALIGDPLKLGADSPGQDSAGDSRSGAMRKVSGRVALLPVALQKTFYADIEGQYGDLIDYLDQIGENNLVSKDYDLQAKTIARTKIYSGTDESSPFTSSAWLETVSAKILKKPFTKAKVDEKTKATLGDVTPKSFNEKLYAEIRGKADEYVNARKGKMGTLSEGEQRVLQLHLGEVKHQVSYIMETLRKFLVGNIYDVAVTDSYETKGILTDIRYDRKGSGSPAAPSKVKLIFAVADPIQTIMFPLSRRLNLRATQRAGERYLSQWDSLIPSSSRENRFIITGNILQGFERFGKKAEVISYTDDKGVMKTGILLPRSVKARDAETLFTHHVVGVEEAYQYLKDTSGAEKKLAVTDKSVSIVSQGAGLIVEVPKAKKSGGKYYLNKELLKYVRYNEFSSRGNKMAARVEEGDVKGFLQALHQETGVKFEVPIPEKNKNMTLDFLGVQTLYEATVRLLKKLYRLIYHREAPNIEIQAGEKDILGVMKKYLGSPGTIPGKARYYVTHAKNAIHKQDRLRSILNKKLAEIFKPLKNKKLRGEFEALAWAGDLEGTEYTSSELKAMGVTPVVAKAYLKHRRFHRHVWRLLASHRKAYGGDTGHIKGHIPHLFENWNVYEVKDEHIEGKAGNYKTSKTLGSIAGTFRSLREATNFANGLNPDQKYLIRPKMFHMPDDFIRKTVLKDASYFRLIRTFEEQFDMTREEATQYVQGVTRRKNRRRFFGNLSERKGQTGFRQKDLHKILSQYYNSAARYITLDDFKASVIPRFEKDFGVDHGRARDAVRDKNLARYIERYIDDVGGVPTEIEDALNASIKSMPYVGQFMRSQRPAIWGINKLLHATSVLKLGVFNLSSGMVNLTQLTNTFAKVPSAHFAWAMKEAMRPWKLMKPGSRAILSRIGVPSDLGLADTGGYSVTHKGGKIVRASMIFFQGAEQLNRRVTGLAAYRWGRKGKGLSHRQALIFAREMIDKTQFDYSVADTAQAFRNPVGRLLGQFKPFAIKQIEFVTGLRGAENIKFWIPMLLLAGLNGIPMIEGASDLIEWLTGKNPLIKTKEFLIKWAGSDPQKKQAAEIAIYGVGSALGVDASKRVGIGDILPRQAGDLLGPSINTIRQAIRITKDGGDKTELVKTFAPSVGNFLTALETVLNDMQVKDPWHRQRLKYTATPVEVAIKAGGLRPLREAKLSDIQAINQYNERTYTRLQQRFIDMAVAALKAGDAAGLVRAITRAAKYGVIVDDKALERELLQKTLPQEVRTLLMTRKVQMEGQSGVMEFLNEETSKR